MRTLQIQPRKNYTSAYQASSYSSSPLPKHFLEELKMSRNIISVLWLHWNGKCESKKINQHEVLCFLAQIYFQILAYGAVNKISSFRRRNQLLPWVTEGLGCTSRQGTPLSSDSYEIYCSVFGLNQCSDESLYISSSGFCRPFKDLCTRLLSFKKLKKMK